LRQGHPIWVQSFGLLFAPVAHALVSGEALKTALLLGALVGDSCYELCCFASQFTLRDALDRVAPFPGRHYCARAAQSTVKVRAPPVNLVGSFAHALVAATGHLNQSHPRARQLAPAPLCQL